jgi:oligopeptide transport system substrate-binding protein
MNCLIAKKGLSIFQWVSGFFACIFPALAGMVLGLLLSQAAFAESVLHRGNRFEPATLDPQKFQTHYEANLILDLFEGLVTYDASGKPTPGVADSWAVSADGLTWTFKLRPNLVWSDGVPISAEDVGFSFRRLMDPATAAQYAQLFYILENGRETNTGALLVERIGVSAPAKDTVVLRLNAPAPYLPELLANAFAAVLPRHVITKHGADWVKPGIMASNGAYMLKVWESQDRIELARNPRFHAAGKVAIDRVVFYPTENLGSALSRFRAGELDMQMEFPTSQIDALRANLPAETKTVSSQLTYYLALNTNNAKLADVRVRRALSLAIERDVIVSRINKLGESPAYTFVPPAIANYPAWSSPDAALGADQRLSQAKQLLSEAGFGPAKPLKISYSFSSTEDFKRIGVAIAGMWKRIGVETELLNREGRVHFAALKQGDFEAGFVGWSADFNDAATFLYVLQSSSVNSNYSRYRNSGFDARMTKAAQTRDASTRAALLQEAEKLALNDQPIIPLYTGVARHLIARRVVGWQPNPLDFYPTRYLSLSAKEH